jgi:hypothetical protein
MNPIPHLWGRPVVGQVVNLRPIVNRPSGHPALRRLQ